MGTAPLYSFLRHTPAEAYLWMAALLALACTDPSGPGLLRLCPLDLLGMWCPGCGLGRSIAYLLQGNLQLAIETHLLAIPAVLILLARISTLLMEAHSRISSPLSP